MDSSFDCALNEREQEVLTLVAAGLSNKAVAEELFLSPHTVAWYVQQIFSKLHVKRRTQAVAVARARGWLDPPAAQPQAPIPLQSQPNLPLQLTSFIGREEEIQEIITLLGDVRCRLLTLVGPGGIGKTRLALEVARRLPDRYSDGIYFVTMQALTSSNRIVPTIASSLGIQLMGDRQNTLEQLIEYCREKSILLVMDNYEHLLDGVQVVSDLLSAAPNIKVLATSRESLNLREEYLYNIGGLRYPDHNQITSTKGYSAVELFSERACQVYPSFSLVDVIPDVVQICQLVDGMPLALELAASWLKSLSCEDIAAAIRRGLDILTTRLRNMPERHRSMCAVFDHSWQSLSDDERMTFQRLSVFRGGFTLEAAHAVAGADVYLLQALADKSFIRRDPTSKRYEIHELLRQYGEARLGQSSTGARSVMDAHCSYFTDLLGHYQEDVYNHRQRDMMQALEPDLDNIRVAWHLAADQSKVDAIGRALHTFAYFHVFRSRFLEEAEALEETIASLESGRPTGQRGVVLATMLSYLGWIYVRIGRYGPAYAVFRRSRSLFRSLNVPPPPGWATEPLTGLSMLASIQGDYTEAEALGEEACRASEVQHDRWNLQVALATTTSACFRQGKYEEAQQYLEQAYAISEQSGDQWFRAIVLNDLGHIARVQGNFAEAKGRYQESMAINTLFNHSQGIAACLNHLGLIAILERDYHEARRLYQESFALYKEIGDTGGVGYALSGLGDAAVASGQHREARQYFLQALQIAKAIHYAPVLFSALLGFSVLFLHTGEREKGIELLASILNHDQSDQETKVRARQVLTSVGDVSEFPVEAENAAWDRGKSLDPERLVQELLDQFTQE